MPGKRFRLTRGTLYSAVFAVGIAQLALAIPAVLQGLFLKDLGPSSSQLTWISDAFLVPVTALELTFGVLGDLFGRKRLMIIGAALLAVGMGVALLTPGAGTSTGIRVLILGIGMAISGAGAAAIMPTSLAMIAAETHTPQARARGIAIWAAALSAGNMVLPVLGGWLATFSYGSDPNASSALGYCGRLAARADQRGPLGPVRGELLLPRGPLAGLAGPGHGVRGPVRAAVRGDPGADRRLGAVPR